MKKSICTFAFLTGLLSFSMAGIIHVPVDQPSIQAGINTAVNGDTVLVADSTYYENINFMGKAITVASYFLLDSDSVHIDSTIINGSQPSDPNKGSVVSFTSGEDTTSVIYGFTITGGTGTLYDINRRIGGGIYCANSGARITHNKIVYNSVTHNQLCLGGGVGSRSDQNSKYVIIEDNFINSNSLYAQNGSSGGGIFVHMQGGSIFRNKIINNLNSGGASNMGFGGGISIYDYIAGRYMVKIIGNSIINNEATSEWADGGGIGGGIDVQFIDVHLMNNKIMHNKVTGAQPEGGAGVRLSGSSGSSTVKNNIISFNSSYSSLGGLWGLGGGIEAWQTVGLTIQENQFEGNECAAGSGLATSSTQGTITSGNTFLNNHSYIGGGVYELQTVGSVISSNRFTGNNADYYGGGIMISECSPGVYNNLIVNNKAVFNGGGLYAGDQNSEPQIINNTIVADTAGVYGGGICSNSVSPLIMNTIIWGNFAPTGGQIYTIGGNTQVVYCEIQGSWSGAGNIDVNPYFSNDTLYCLSDSSQCVDAGDPNRMDPEDPKNPGNPLWPAKGTLRSDMGAYGGYTLVDLIKHHDNSSISNDYYISQNYPNPFNPKTTIEFQLPHSEYVTLKIFTLLGQEVATLIGNQRLTPGRYKCEWNAQNMASGAYFYTLEASNFFVKRKMLLIR